MRNLKIKTKLLVGFVVLAVFTAAVGLTGVFGLLSLEESEQQANRIMINANYISRTLANVHEQRIWYREGVLRITDPDRRQEAVGNLEQLDREYERLIEFLNGNVVDETGISGLNTVNSIYNDQYAPLRAELIGMIEAGDNRDTYAVMDRLRATTDTITIELEVLAEDSMSKAESTSIKGAVAMQRMIMILAVISAAAVLMALLLGIYIARQISRPVKKMVGAAEKLSKGDIDVDIKVDSRDEVGVLAEAFQHMADGIREQAQVLQAVAGGDYRVEIGIRSEHDVMNRAIEELVCRTSQMLIQMRAAALRVSQGSSEIAQASQELASGSEQQAAAVEQFSAVLTQLSERTRENEENAEEAMTYVVEASDALGTGVACMNDVVLAMEAIEEGSRNITRVIKVIDEIAFQTNILSLNAAVEAARAGQHGKGFAVVADEVRNLAGKSAEAAKETADLIENSIRSIQEGLSFVQHSNESINKVTEKAVLVSQKVEEVRAASAEQSKSIREISMGIEQISMVVQSNSAMAQQTAASSQSMAAQAQLLDEIAGHFRLNQNENALSGNDPELEIVSSVSSGFAIASDDKYGVS